MPPKPRPTIRDVCARWTDRVAASDSPEAQDSLHRSREMRQSMSLPEVVLWQRLRGGRVLGLRFRRQHVLGPYFADFYCHELKLVLEVDGSSHSTRGEHDQARDHWMTSQGLKVVRLPATDILRDPGDVVDRIARYAQRVQEQGR